MTVNSVLKVHGSLIKGIETLDYREDRRRSGSTRRSHGWPRPQSASDLHFGEETDLIKERNGFVYSRLHFERSDSGALARERATMVYGSGNVGRRGASWNCVSGNPN